MANIAAHTLMFLSAVLFAIMLEADVTATMIIGLLLFICVVSLGRFMTLRTWVAVCCALCSASVAVPVWITLLPVLAADMGYRLFPLMWGVHADSRSSACRLSPHSPSRSAA